MLYVFCLIVLLIVYWAIDHTVMHLLHGRLNFEISGLYCFVDTTFSHFQPAQPAQLSTVHSLQISADVCFFTARLSPTPLVIYTGRLLTTEMQPSREQERNLCFFVFSRKRTSWYFVGRK